jgi:hypothetical protein
MRIVVDRLRHEADGGESQHRHVPDIEGLDELTVDREITANLVATLHQIGENENEAQHESQLHHHVVIATNFKNEAMISEADADHEAENHGEIGEGCRPGDQPAPMASWRAAVDADGRAKIVDGFHHGKTGRRREPAPQNAPVASTEQFDTICAAPAAA